MWGKWNLSRSRVFFFVLIWKRKQRRNGRKRRKSNYLVTNSWSSLLSLDFLFLSLLLFLFSHINIIIFSYSFFFAQLLLLLQSDISYLILMVANVYTILHFLLCKRLPPNHILPIFLLFLSHITIYQTYSTFSHLK